MPERVLTQLPRPETLAQRVQERLREAILQGDLRAGQRLVEATLATQLGVSRAPLREALRRLEREGLVENNARKGTFIARFSEADWLELHAVRTLLEAFAARAAARLAPQETGAVLQAVVNRMRGVVSRGRGREQLADLDFAFHESLVQAAENRWLLALWRNLSTPIRLSILTATSAYARRESLAEDIAASHQVIVDAVGRGDPEAAEASVRRRVDALRPQVLATLGDTAPRATRAGSKR